MIPRQAQTEIRQRSAARPAFTFIEVAVSAAMVAVLLVLIGQLLVLLKRHSQAAERHAIAMQTVENSLEEFTALPWNEIDACASRGVEPSRVDHETLATGEAVWRSLRINRPDAGETNRAETDAQSRT